MIRKGSILLLLIALAIGTTAAVLLAEDVSGEGALNVAQTSTPSATSSPLNSVSATATGIAATPTATPTATSTPPGTALFVILIRKEDLDKPRQDPLLPSVNNLASFYGSITAYANGARCITADLVRGREPNGTVVLRVGLPDQPRACRTEGAAVSLTVFSAANPITRGERRLVGEFTLKLGTTVTLTNIATEPVFDGPGELPSVGSGSEATSSGMTRAWLLYALVGAAVAAIALGVSGVWIAARNKGPAASR